MKIALSMKCLLTCLALFLLGISPARGQGCTSITYQPQTHRSEIVPGVTYSENLLRLCIGDSVHFTTTKTNAVVCVEYSGVFGAKEFRIPPEKTLRLLVQDFAPIGRFKYIIRKGDLETGCDQVNFATFDSTTDGGEEGGEGEVGGK